MTQAVQNEVLARGDTAHSGVRRWIRNHGLSIVLIGSFLLLWIGQAVAGWLVFNESLREKRQPPATFAAYLHTGHFLEATAENWESEFLQLGAFVALTAFLYQKGSPESHDPDKPAEPEPPVTSDSPWPARAGGWIKAIYSCSLSLTFGILFAISLALHAIGGAVEYNREQIAHGEPTVTTLGFVATSQFWFESLQNWQSEFLAIAAMVILAIFLRQKGSPESKSVTAPVWENEA